MSLVMVFWLYFRGDIVWGQIANEGVHNQFYEDVIAFTIWLYIYTSQWKSHNQFKSVSPIQDMVYMVKW